MSARDQLLDAAVAVIRRQGLHATTVDELCATAGVTKGAFFHHFASKEALAVAAAAHWGATTGAMFATAAYHDLDDPAERVLAYLDLRATMTSADAAEYTCLAGTMVQEAFATSLAVRDACAEAIFGHVRTLEADIAAALAAADNPLDVSAATLATHTQTVLQGAFVLAKAAGDADVVTDSIEHLRRYLRCTFGLAVTPALSTTTPDRSPPQPCPTPPTAPTPYEPGHRGDSARQALPGQGG